jgi:hypothetical protein
VNQRDGRSGTIPQGCTTNEAEGFSDPTMKGGRGAIGRLSAEVPAAGGECGSGTLDTTTTDGVWTAETEDIDTPAVEVTPVVKVSPVAMDIGSDKWGLAETLAPSHHLRTASGGVEAGRGMTRG